MKAIIVEDEPAQARRLECCVAETRWLEPAGSAATRQQAVEMARRVHPDLVLLDFGLHGVADEGFAVWDVLHHLPEPPAVIAVTGTRNPRTMVRAMRYGAYDFIVKPFTAADVKARLAGYATFHRYLAGLQAELAQKSIDKIFLRWRARPCQLPPGIEEQRLAAVIEVLRAADEPLRAADVAERLGVSRETANRYLIYLYADGTADRFPSHGRPGHPSYRYALASPWKPAPDAPGTGE
ncbi:MAG: response regulator [Nocardiopsaceae bacterium]|nr:response regulator [Nocardiopsaceae bacterium]